MPLTSKKDSVSSGLLTPAVDRLGSADSTAMVLSGEIGGRVEVTDCLDHQSPWTSAAQNTDRSSMFPEQAGIVNGVALDTVGWNHESLVCRFHAPYCHLIRTHALVNNRLIVVGIMLA